MFSRAAAMVTRPRLALGMGAAALGAASFNYPSQCENRRSVGLNPKEWTALTLSKVTPLSANTAVYRFAYDDPDSTSGMTVASCLLTKAALGKEKSDGSRGAVLRPYTPISRPSQKGYLELAVKTYPDGKMSKHMASLRPGDKLEFKGPIVKTAYRANQYKEIGMVAGGTGIAPMLQVLDEILENPNDKTKVSLVFANVSVDDILLKDFIDAREKLHPDRLTTYYVVDKAPTHGTIWKGGVGYITPRMLTGRLPPPSDESMVYVCGPPPMYKAVCGSKGTPEDPKAQGEVGGILKSLGYTSASVFKF